MKKNVKQALVPLAVMVFGAAAAFATNAAKENTSKKALMKAYHYDITRPVGDRCVETIVDCNNSNGLACIDASNTTYWEIPTENGLQCTGVLFKN